MAVAPASDAAEAARAACAAHANAPDALIEILHDVQAALGCVPKDAVPVIAEAINRSRAEVHGVVSFYHDFRSEPAGRVVVKLCRAEACQAVGCEALAQEAEKRLGVAFGETSMDGRVTLEAVYCLGDCALGPAALIGDELHGRLTAEKLEQLVKEAGA